MTRRETQLTVGNHPAHASYVMCWVLAMGKLARHAMTRDRQYMAVFLFCD